jgi:hypothetical protein
VNPPEEELLSEELEMPLEDELLELDKLLELLEVGKKTVLVLESTAL